MSDLAKLSAASEAIEQTAAAWVLRLDAGLSPAEEAELADWLAADPRHESCLAEHQQGWDRFAPLAAAADVTTETSAFAPAPRSTSDRKILRFALPALAAAVVALGFFVLRPRVDSPAPLAQAAPRPVLLPLCEKRTLDDGSVVELNRGAAIVVTFTAAERRVRLERGEAHFQVAKDVARPFIVSAGAIEVKAVGTAFDVRFDPTTVEVVVTEGRVGVERVDAAAPNIPEAKPVQLSAGEHTVISLAPSAPAPVVATLTAPQIAARLAWQPKLLDYGDATLAEIVAEFNRRNPVRLIVDDPALAALRLTASIRSDNMDGFVRLLEANYGVAVEPRGGTEIVLRRK